MALKDLIFKPSEIPEWDIALELAAVAVGAAYPDAAAHIRGHKGEEWRERAMAAVEAEHMAEIDRGLFASVEQGWIEETEPGKFRITEKGRAHVEKLSRAG